MSTLSQQPWWKVPENFDAPVVVYLEEEQEEQIFGHNDAHLRCIEVHSQTLIQLESWFTARGQTRVTIVGPPRARQWLMDMIWSLGNRDPYLQATGSRCFSWSPHGVQGPSTWAILHCTPWP
uniref:KH-like RNA-binding domain-containing protein n=1 Tax=Oryctolagus cuniculus TaxID=9986 RepID=G1SGB1_RABIT